MRTTKIKIRNLFGITETELDGRSVELTGANGVGKTSVIDALRYALTNKSDRNIIVRQGEKEGEILIETDTFVATGTDRGYNRLYALLSERHNCTGGDIDPDKLGELFCEFVNKVIMMFGTPDKVYCDSAEQTLILGLRATARKKGLGWLRIENALKAEINDRIRCAVRLMAQGRFYYMDYGCETLVNALCGAVWNPKNLIKDERLDDGTSDIDTLDAFEYTFERDIRKFIKYE